MQVASPEIVRNVSGSLCVEERRSTRRGSECIRYSYHGTGLRVSNNCALR